MNTKLGWMEHSREILVAGVLLGTAALSSGCGTGNEPGFSLGDSSQTPQLALAVTPTYYAGSVIFQPFNPQGLPGAPANNGFVFQFGSFTAGQVLSPGDGYITDLQAVSTGGIVGFVLTIRHNTHVSSEIGYLTASNYRVGDWVTTGAPLGTAYVAGSVGYIIQGVVQDGSLVCPYNYLTTDAKHLLNAQAYFNVRPCIE